jgi:hypothetical protein
VTSNADGAANADGERVKAQTLSALGYLAQVTASELALWLLAHEMAFRGLGG